MSTSTPHESDLATLERLNAEYLYADQYQDLKRYEEILAEDFTATLPDYKLRNKTEFLRMIAAGRPFTDPQADDVRIRILGDFALVHGHITFKTLSGQPREGRYTDDWQRRDGTLAVHRGQCHGRADGVSPEGAGVSPSAPPPR